MHLKANNVEGYLAQVPKERVKYFKKLRATILENLLVGFKETLIYGMVGYVVPHSLYQDGYHVDSKLPLPFLNIASQKNFISFYHMGIYANPKLLDWFVAEYCKRKMDMGKCCIRFKKSAEIPFELMGKLVQKMSVDQWVSLYEKNVKKQ